MHTATGHFVEQVVDALAEREPHQVVGALTAQQLPLEQVPVAVEQVATWDGRAAAQVLAALVVVAGSGAEGGAESGPI